MDKDKADLSLEPRAALKQMIETIDELEMTWEFLNLTNLRQAIERTLTKLDKSEKPDP